MKTTIKKSKIKGIHYSIKTVGSSRFLTIVHSPSEKAIHRFTSAPVHRTSDIIKLSEELLSTLNWNVPEEEIGEEHVKVVSELKKRIKLDTHMNKYVVEYQGK